MNLYLTKDGEQLPGDLVLEGILRSDLAPVPRTLEFTVRLKDDLEQRLADGASVWAGREHLEYTIVHGDRSPPMGVVQNGTALQAKRYIAFLAGCKGLASPLSRAVIQANAPLSSIYLACGARVSIAKDFPVSRFAALVGDVPSVPIAVALQEEGAALVLRNGQLSIERLRNLMQQAPVQFLGQFDSSAYSESQLTEQHQIPMGFSINASGQAVRGDYSLSRRAAFRPHHDERMLRNLSCVLVRRRVLDSSMAQQYQAGDVLDINGAAQLVITAAHRFRQTEGRLDTTSRFWVGDLSV
ncbi:hypothetical protein BJP27_24020 (plasmid) [Pseudomonas oryzihabitans]|nr:hypothetical protein BJP27_24020 [Pseudomonas psychrotolerans]